MALFTNENYKLAANTIRCLSIDGVQAANSGHPGAPMGLADIAAVLWLKYLKHDPAQPKWADRDRFVLSGGHASMLLYSLLHLSGYKVTLDDLRNFRQFGSNTPGHPELGHTDGVETTTGPLGQGIANAVGMAMAERMLAARFNTKEFPVVNHRTWCFCGDGDLMEGISHEACSLAGHLKLDKLVVLYDSNRITIEGRTDLAFTDNTLRRFQGYNWYVLQCDGHNYASIENAITKAVRSHGRPVLIICNTTIGKGSPHKADTHAVHGAPLGADEVRATKTALGFDPDQSFVVPEGVYELFRANAARGERLAQKWARTLKSLRHAKPEQADLWQSHLNDYIPTDLASHLPTFDPAKPLATRSASGNVLNALAPHLPQLIGGSADLAPSNMTNLNDYPAVQANDFSGRNIHFGVRELGMGAVMTGIQVHGGFRVFGGTFFVFSDYCKPAIRVAALQKTPAIYVFTHDSVYVGEDGPTHEPVEQLAALRATPGLTIIRPSDPTETGAAWITALQNKNGPTLLLLTRQNMAVIDRTQHAPAENLEKGAYTLWQTKEGAPDVTVIASGSEVEIALEAAKRVTNANIRVVSMPSWELFERQPLAYRNSVLDPKCRKRVVVEAATSFGWHKYATDEGTIISLDTFGACGPFKTLAKHFGFTADHVQEAINKYL